MRRLILMRHAKSSWAEAGQRDHDRPLNRRGRRASAAVGAWLKAGGYLPELALVSNARRCQETWAGVVEEIGAAPTIYLPGLYHAEAEDILAAARGAGAAAVVLVLGHQPGIGDFAARILAEPAADQDFDRYPTAATAVIDFDAAVWTEIDWGQGRIRDFVIPRALE